MFTTRPHRSKLALLALLPVLSACTSTREMPTFPQLEGVAVTFEGTGAVPEYWSQRLADFGDSQSTQSGKDYWFCLRNDSSQVIQFETGSMYLERKLSDWHQLPNGNRVSTLGPHKQILIVYSLETRRGRPIPWGSDMRLFSSLISGRSLLFGVPKTAFAHGQRVFVSYQAIEPSSWQAIATPTYRIYLSLPQ